MASSLCENCNKRPKFGAHKYCGKACATQAVAKTARSKQSHPQVKQVQRNPGHKKGVSAPQKSGQLCIFCGQKPKFNGFDYCGRSCAALAGQPKPPALQVAPTTKQKTSAPTNRTQAPSPPKPQKAHRTMVPAAQADESTEEGEEPEEEDDDGASTDLDAYPSNSASESEDEPNVPASAAVQPQGTKGTSKGGKPGNGGARIAPGICAIPGCGQPVHVDRHGVKARYCSTKHREEAAKLGLEAACIMCQRYPQSTSDYFCSSACRDQSMTKT